MLYQMDCLEKDRLSLIVLVEIDEFLAFDIYVSLKRVIGIFHCDMETKMVEMSLRIAN